MDIKSMPMYIGTLGQFIEITKEQLIMSMTDYVRRNY